MSPESLIPEQHEGVAKEIHHTTEAGSGAEAALLFEAAKQRLLDVTAWSAIADGASAKFLLFDHKGKAIQRSASEGDLVRIDLPGPHRASGNGYDWVALENLKEGEDAQGPWVTLSTRPTADPAANESDTAHFFGAGATGTFIIRQQGTTVTGDHYGRNELPNTAEGGFLDQARALLITTGAYLGLSDVQWSNLIKGFITP